MRCTFLPQRVSPRCPACVTSVSSQVCWTSPDTRVVKGDLVALKLKAEFPVKCRDSAVLNELETGGVTFDASNCTSNAFVSNGVGEKIACPKSNCIIYSISNLIVYSISCGIIHSISICRGLRKTRQCASNQLIWKRVAQYRQQIPLPESLLVTLRPNQRFVRECRLNNV